MKNRIYIMLALSLLLHITAAAQVSNRQKVIALILWQSKAKPHSNPLSQPEILATPSASVMLAPAAEIPKYALPKGNVVCRFEDYVQMHTPMKLNIGVGGQ